tara:strand:- start:59 stop:358 length:300 start_codon:yes stop_codon:yes gene_type:complete
LRDAYLDSLLSFPDSLLKAFWITQVGNPHSATPHLVPIRRSDTLACSTDLLSSVLLRNTIEDTVIGKQQLRPQANPYAPFEVDASLKKRIKLLKKLLNI